jgi:hypothetical protein
LCQAANSSSISGSGRRTPYEWLLTAETPGSPRSVKPSTLDDAAVWVHDGLSDDFGGFAAIAAWNAEDDRVVTLDVPPEHAIQTLAVR